MTWHPSCDPARMARWQAIDRKRRHNSAAEAGTTPAGPAPTEEQMIEALEHRHGTGIKARRPGERQAYPCRALNSSVLSGPRSL